jgi:nitroreductase
MLDQEVKMKDFIKKVAPPPILRAAGKVIGPFENVREFALDALRYSRHSSSRDGVTGPTDHFSELEAQITKDYHRVEKGLTLPEPKRPFGLEVKERLRALVPEAKRREPEAPFVTYAEDALLALERWNCEAEIDDVVSPVNSLQRHKLSRANLESFFGSRRSVRNFDAETPVSIDDLEQATAWALNTPSVCNRQAGRVRYFTNEADIIRVLKLQNGNAGFRTNVRTVAVVTVDSRLFTGANERNQRWIDGGLFAMTLVWALHGVGLSTCMLNWSASNEQSARMRAAAGLDDYEDIVVLIAIGHPLSGHRIARSERRSVKDVMSHG